MTKNNKIQTKRKYSDDFSPFTFHLSLQTGYTLIELLTVIGILSVIGAIVVSIVFVSLTGTKKSDLVESLRQGGDAALSQVVKSVRFADALTDPAACVPSIQVSTITIKQLNSSAQTTFACSANSLTANGTPLVDTNNVSISNCSFVCSQSSLNDPPTITIQFTLQPKTVSAFADSKASVQLQSSVTMRNYSR